MNNIQKYEALLIAAQKAQAHPTIIARYAFLYNWALWKAGNKHANTLARHTGRAKVNSFIRKHGHRMAMHHNQLKRMGA